MGVFKLAMKRMPGDEKMRELFSKKLQKLLNSRGVSQAELSRILEVSESAVGKWLLKKAMPRMGLIQRLADHFNVEKSYFLEDHSFNVFDIPGVMPIKTKKIPLLGNIAAGQPIEAIESFDSYVQCGAEITANFCLKVSGDSMINARIYDGDIVFIQNQPTVENGEIAAVFVDGNTTLKRVFKQNDSIVLQSENSKYAPQIYTKDNCSEIRILGKAIAFQGDVI